RIAGHLPSLTLSEAGVDHPTAGTNTIGSGLADEHPVAQQTAVHSLDFLIGRNGAHHLISGWGTEDIQRHCGTEDKSVHGILLASQAPNNSSCSMEMAGVDVGESSR